MNEERLPLVDENGVVLGSAKRSQVHGNPSLLHPVVHCIVTDRKGRILLQLRSRTKDIQPGKWDTSVGGHVLVDESIEQALFRELEEEIGICHAHVRFLYRYIMRNAIESELISTFLCESEGPFTPQASEIDALRFWSAQEIQNALGTGVFSPNFEQEFQRFRQGCLLG
ncbi:MAG TPA: NUDIX domain-containing protein [Polyangiaceae bacterium]|jgi:isopentenyldiphosphate isomerase|nr:MAG: putative Nudix hydrolase YfcD [Deltaproteobacteria bacterium ADurb.Bin207]HNS97437.1 NUDIX domain-containing protein [Polyangiaceae bacterium]HNZ21859.1 NUDIX domain-containing protein [Polyangiaceae bacterium]HOD23190.1 NUDIX domain-containing protein [Polyangiaceae bacterium]HOE48737.1 NUDIX domain-containing protein [Polyangiaceae bacterium]